MISSVSATIYINKHTSSLPQEVKQDPLLTPTRLTDMQPTHDSMPLTCCVPYRRAGMPALLPSLTSQPLRYEPPPFSFRLSEWLLLLPLATHVIRIHTRASSS